MKKTVLKESLKRVTMLCSIVMSTLLCAAHSSPFGNDEDYILFISSINFNQVLTKEIYWHIHNHYQQTNLFISAESLSVPSINSAEKAQIQIDRLAQKYEFPPKAIIFMGEPGFMICRELYDSIWKDVPTIIVDSFERVPATLDLLYSKAPLTPENTVPSEVWREGYNVTTISQPFFIKETIQLMQQVLPKMDKIAFISDDRYASAVFREKVEDVIKNNFPELTLQHLTHITTEAMLDSLLSYDLHTGVIYYSWFEHHTTKENSTYLIDHIQEIISGFSNTPLFTLVDLGVASQKFAGGHYTSITAFGEELIYMLEQTLSGVPARDIRPSTKEQGTSFLNYLYLQSFDIPASSYHKKGVVYINAPLSFYQQYKYAIYLFLISITFIIIIFSLYIHALKQKERFQENENKNLKRNEQMRIFFESVLDNLQVGVTIKSINEGFKYTSWNKKVSEILGYQQDKIIGASYEFHQNKTLAHDIQVLDRKILQDKKNCMVVKEYFINEQEKRFLQIIKSIIPYDETDLRIVSTITDVSDIYKNKQHLETLNKKYELTLNVAGIQPWSVDLVTQQIIFQDQVMGISFFEVAVHPDDYEQLKEDYYHLIEGRIKKLYCQYRIKRQLDKQEYYWIATSSEVEKRDESEKPISIICASIDINDQKTLEMELRLAKEEAEKANLMKSAFIANMSHEIRTPLNAIVGFSEVLLDMEDSEEKQTFMEIIRTNNELLLQLVNDIIDISRMESGKLDLIYDYTNVNHIMDEVSQLTAFQRLSGEVTLHIEKPLPEFLLYTDKKCIIQVLSNFITNAIKFTEKGEITIGYLLKDKDTIYFYVRDTGYGIPEEQQSSIFDRFFKVDNFTQGTGLGLSISKKIIKELGGTIGVISKEGEGSEFWFTLPSKQTF